MRGNVFRKLGRVAGDLLLHPQYLPGYLQCSPWRKHSPLHFGLPWFSFASIAFLDRYITSAMEVFEFGAGGSTLYFARRAGRVISTENDAHWVDRVERALAAEGCGNVELQYRPYDFRYAQDFEKSDYLNSMPERLFDIIVVDCAEDHRTVRPLCFHHAETRVRPGGIIIVDDSWRYPELHATHHAKARREFRSVGPCRYGVTSTDIYFY